MALIPGTRFGSYEITGEIGAGGMGEVYRARDTQLERDVAIKVLPETFAADSDRVARFEQEAKLLAALNHPNIAQIFGLEKSSGVLALVIELVEGPTLEERIAAGALPIDEALGYAYQIAAALEAAHGQGIVHRDLKPANIKLRPDGTVKVLDFGVAKALGGPGQQSGPRSPSLTTPAMTEAGMILGTAAYMAPEQARGRPVDQRADVWAFGCVLYEMLTRQAAFGGEDVTTTLARVLERDVDLDALPASTPPRIRRALQLCLAKEPKERLHAIGDVRLALAGAFDAGMPAEGHASARAPLWRRALPIAAAVIITTLAIGLGENWLGAGEDTAPAPRGLTRFNHLLPDHGGFPETWGRTLGISPDGTYFVYIYDKGLLLRRMDEIEPELLVAGSPAFFSLPVVSPDGAAVAFWDRTTNELRRIPIGGGAVTRIAAKVDRSFGASWSKDGSFFYARLDGIYRVPADGSAPQERIIATEGRLQAYGPELLPDGDSLLFSISPRGDWDNGEIVVESLSTGERLSLVSGGTSAHYLPTGQLVYAFGERLFAVPFDLESLSVTGQAEPVLERVRRSDAPWNSGAAHYAVAANGTLVYIPAPDAPRTTLVWVDRDGVETPIPSFEPGRYGAPRLSPTGTSIVFNSDPGNALWIWNIETDTRTPLALGENGGDWPVWTPDGQHVAYHPGVGEIVDWRTVNNTGSPETIAQGASLDSGAFHPEDFTPSGDSVVFYGRSRPGTGIDIGIASIAAPDEPEWLLDGPADERNADISPDGSWIAYQSNESGRFEVYVRPFPNVDGGSTPISNAGGVQPRWSSDGRELFYIEPGSPHRMIAVSIDVAAGNLRYERRVLFDWRYGIAQSLNRRYDVTPDGQRFITVKSLDDETRLPPQIVVVENWLEDVERRARAGTETR